VIAGVLVYFFKLERHQDEISAFLAGRADETRTA